MRSRWLAGLTVSGIALAGSACAKIPPTHYYTLEIQGHGGSESATDPKSGDFTIGVMTFEVDPPYDQDRIVYRRSPGSPEVAFYAYHRWAAPLSSMLPRVVSEGFQETAGLASIEPASSGRNYVAQVLGRVLEFEEIDDPTAPRVRVQLSLRLRLTDGDVVWSKTLEGEAASAAPTVSGIVESMRSALASAFELARPELAAVIASRSRSPQ